MNKKMVAAMSFGMTLFLAACGQSETAPAETKENDNEGKFKIYTTIYPFECFTERVGAN